MALNTAENVRFNEDEPVVTECPECTATFNECTAAAHKGYTDAVERAADSISKSSKEIYSAKCAKARGIRDKALADCRSKYQKCCVTETDKKEKKEAASK